MKAQLRLDPHCFLTGQTVIEVWYDGQMVGTIYGADGPGVRFISKHPLTPEKDTSDYPELDTVVVMACLDC